MSLDWSIAKVKDREQLTKEPADIRTTESLVWLCRALDMNGITEKNLEEFVRRLRIWEHVHGGGPIPREAVERRIGLSTNVSQLPFRQWEKKMKDVWWRDVLYNARKKSTPGP